jgi:hypothetical protein
VARGREEKKGRGQWACSRGGGRGPGAAVGSSGWPATAPGRWARAAPCHMNRGGQRGAGVTDRRDRSEVGPGEQ